MLHVVFMVQSENQTALASFPWEAPKQQENLLQYFLSMQNTALNSALPCSSESCVSKTLPMAEFKHDTLV